VHVRGRNADEPRGLRQLPRDFDELARGNRMPRRPPNAGLRDERATALVPGVANRDARVVCDLRVERLVAARDQGDRRAFGRALAEAFRMGLWRGQNVVGFDVFLEDVVGISAREGRELADAGARELGAALQRADDRVVATWFRAEAALANAGTAASVSLRGDGTEARLVVDVAAERADLLLAEIGKRVVALSKFLPVEPAPRRRPPRP
jgi:hypothetical protein